jgi:iron(III) transport system ATP-binding protein
MAHTNILKKILNDVAAELKITLLLSSHQPQDILSWADEIIILQSGEIIQQGTPEFIYYNPINEYAAGLFGAYNIFTPQQARQFGLTVKETVFIRPEKVCIGNYGNGVEAIVKEIAFMGSFYELTVYVHEINIILRVWKNEWKINDIVYIKISA